MMFDNKGQHLIPVRSTLLTKRLLRSYQISQDLAQLSISLKRQTLDAFVIVS